jgi:invasion protein IalB
MEVDDLPPMPMEIETCDTQGCYAGTLIAPETLDAMRNGTELRFVVQNVQRSEIRMTMKLGGFTGAYERME